MFDQGRETKVEGRRGYYKKKKKNALKDTDHGSKNTHRFFPLNNMIFKKRYNILNFVLFSTCSIPINSITGVLNAEQTIYKHSSTIPYSSEYLLD